MNVPALTRPGSGPLVVFCNGLGLTHDFWAPVLRRLPDVPTVVFDRPRRPADFDGDSVANTAEIDAALAAAGWAPSDGPVVVVGHSFGGLLAEAYARLRPERAGALVLVDPSVPSQYAARGEAGPLPGWRRQLVRAVRSGPVATVLRGAMPWALDRGGVSSTHGRVRLRALPADLAARLASSEHLQRAMLDDHHLPEVAAEVLDLRHGGPLPIPTIVLVGALGPLPLRLPQRAWMAAQQDQLPAIAEDAELIDLAGGHLLMLDCPDDVAAAIVRARSRCPGPA